MAPEFVNIPICSIPEVFMDNAVNDYRYFLQMKAREGRFLADPSKYPPKTLSSLCRRKWLKLHEGKYYITKTVDVFPLEGRYTHAKLPVGCLDDPKLFKAMLFVIGVAYLMSPQAQRGRKSRRKRSRRQVNESVHIGGVSLTLCMSFFGAKKTWCFNMKKLCEKLKLAKWKRRFVSVKPVPGPDGTWRYPVHAIDQLAEGAGRFRMTKAGELVEEVTAKFRIKVDPILHIPFEYRRLTHERYL